MLFLIWIAFIVTTHVYGEAEQAVDLVEADVSQNKPTGDSIPKRELLLLQEIPTVVTPAKVAQSVLESPSTITVLTREDIRRYGATSFTNILRNVPGVDVMFVSPTDSNISMRGFNQLIAGKVLSLVDDMPIYVDFYGMTMWELLPISIGEIERVEIVKGPGSALYGANAFDGVVNIITDSAPAAAGTRVNTMVSQFGKLTGVLTHNNGVGDLDYKLSTGWDRLSGWTDEDNDTGENRRFNGRLWYSIDDKSTFRLLGRIQDLRGDVTMLSGLDPTRHDTMVYHMKTDYSRPNTKYQASWRRIAGKTRYEEPTLYYTESDAFDIDLQHSFHPLDSNLITWGLSYRFNRMDSDILDTLHSQNLWAGYIQDQIRLSKALSLTAGLRYDRHPLTGNNLSPRGSIVYSPARGHALRASTGRAFQNPSFLDSYLSMIYKMTILPFPVPIDIETRGNRDLSPEWITSFELGYQGTFGTRLRGRVDLFLNNLDGLIGFEMVDTYDENALFPGSPGGIIPAATSLFNGHDADATGGEVDAEFLVTRWLSAHGNYSYQRVTDSDTGERIESAPRHKMNAGLCAKLGQGLLISLFANHVDKTVWDNIEIDPYTMLNSAVSYRTRDERMQIALSVTNLLNDKHKEHPQGDEICRSVVLSLTIQ